MHVPRRRRQVTSSDSVSVSDRTELGHELGRRELRGTMNAAGSIVAILQLPVPSKSFTPIEFTSCVIGQLGEHVPRHRRTPV